MVLSPLCRGRCRNLNMWGFLNALISWVCMGVIRLGVIMPMRM